MTSSALALSSPPGSGDISTGHMSDGEGMSQATKNGEATFGRRVSLPLHHSSVLRTRGNTTRAPVMRKAKEKNLVENCKPDTKIGPHVDILLKAFEEVFHVMDAEKEAAENQTKSEIPIGRRKGLKALDTSTPSTKKSATSRRSSTQLDPSSSLTLAQNGNSHLMDTTNDDSPAEESIHVKAPSSQELSPISVSKPVNVPNTSGWTPVNASTVVRERSTRKKKPTERAIEASLITQGRSKSQENEQVTNRKQATPEENKPSKYGSKLVLARDSDNHGDEEMIEIEQEDINRLEGSGITKTDGDAFLPSQSVPTTPVLQHLPLHRNTDATIWRPPITAMNPPTKIARRPQQAFLVDQDVEGLLKKVSLGSKFINTNLSTSSSSTSVVPTTTTHVSNPTGSHSKSVFNMLHDLQAPPPPNDKPSFRQFTSKFSVATPKPKVPTNTTPSTVTNTPSTTSSTPEVSPAVAKRRGRPPKVRPAAPPVPVPVVAIKPKPAEAGSANSAPTTPDRPRVPLVSSPTMIQIYAQNVGSASTFMRPLPPKKQAKKGVPPQGAQGTQEPKRRGRPPKTAAKLIQTPNTISNSIENGIQNLNGATPSSGGQIPPWLESGDVGQSSILIGNPESTLSPPVPTSFEEIRRNPKAMDLSTIMLAENVSPQEQSTRHLQNGGVGNVGQERRNGSQGNNKIQEDPEEEDTESDDTEEDEDDEDYEYRKSRNQRSPHKNSLASRPGTPAASVASSDQTNKKSKTKRIEKGQTTLQSFFLKPLAKNSPSAPASTPAIAQNGHGNTTPETPDAVATLGSNIGVSALETDNGEMDIDNVANTPTPVKRPRGRPRKHPLPEPQVKPISLDPDDTVEEEPPVVKRKRGRPRKIVVENPDEPPKKKRGKYRKRDKLNPYPSRVQFSGTHCFSINEKAVEVAAVEQRGFEQKALEEGAGSLMELAEMDTIDARRLPQSSAQAEGAGKEGNSEQEQAVTGGIELQWMVPETKWVYSNEKEMREQEELELSLRGFLATGVAPKKVYNGWGGARVRSNLNREVKGLERGGKGVGEGEGVSEPVYGWIQEKF